GNTREVPGAQFAGGFFGFAPPEFSRILIAYEPVWAIGTGRTATPEMAAESHRIIRELAVREFGEGAASGLRILYGGSVKPDNIGALMARAETDGAPVRAASLVVGSFSGEVTTRRA